MVALTKGYLVAKIDFGLNIQIVKKLLILCGLFTFGL